MAGVTPTVARTRLIGGGILVATGLVWISQGTGLIGGGSFMVGDPFWAWLGRKTGCPGGPEKAPPWAK